MPKFIKVYRPNEPGWLPARSRLGVIQKATYEFRKDSQAIVSEGEFVEMEDVVQSYRAAEEAQARAEALRFPEIARRVTDYYTQYATDVEKRLISVALWKQRGRCGRLTRERTRPPKPPRQLS